MGFCNVNGNYGTTQSFLEKHGFNLVIQDPYQGLAEMEHEKSETNSTSKILLGKTTKFYWEIQADPNRYKVR